MGDHVKVIGGTFEGDTGLIVRVEDNIVVLFSDLTMHEVCFISLFFLVKCKPKRKLYQLFLILKVKFNMFCVMYIIL